jgi:hypothetical protein
MAFNPTPAQRAKLRKGKATIEGAGASVDVWGTIGTLEYFGFPVDESGSDLSLMGISRSVSRAAGKRSRWLGDTQGVSVGASTANVAFYPSRRGNALPGTPVQLANLTTGEKWTVQVNGPMGAFIDWLDSNRPGFDMQVYGKTGNRYSAPLLAESPT